MCFLQNLLLFCHFHFFRKKRIDLVYKELKYFKDDLGVEYNYFWADTFLAWTSSEFEEFCEMYQDIKLPFWMQTRPETISDYKIKKLAGGLNNLDMKKIFLVVFFLLQR